MVYEKLARLVENSGLLEFKQLPGKGDIGCGRSRSCARCDVPAASELRLLPPSGPLTAWPVSRPLSDSVSALLGSGEGRPVKLFVDPKPLKPSVGMDVLVDLVDVLLTVVSVSRAGSNCPSCDDASTALGGSETCTIRSRALLCIRISDICCPSSGQVVKECEGGDDEPELALEAGVGIAEQ